MPLPLRSCDPLGREIRDPVFDPITGICYRNPCAAEEAGVVDWLPGCVIGVPSYGGESFAPMDTWASEVWWTGRGGRRRPRWRPRHQRPGRAVDGGGIVRQPGGRLASSGSGGIVRQPGGRLYSASDGDRGTIVRQPGQTLAKASGLVVQPPTARLYSSLSPSYSAAPPSARADRVVSYGPRYSAQTTPTATFSGGAVKQSYSAAPGGYARATRSASLKGLGQTTTHPLVTAIANVTGAWARAAVAIALGATIPPLLVGGLVRVKTKSWGKALAAGAATVAVEGAVLGAMRERRAASAPAASSSTSPVAMAYIR